MKWIPVSEHNEHIHGVEVLAKNNKNKLIIGDLYYIEHYNRWDCDMECKCLRNVTHFIPLDQLKELENEPE